MKSENLAIGFSIVIQQVLKAAKDQKSANQKLYEIGQEMGLRMSDEFNSRDCSYLSPAETTKAMILKICKDSLGLGLELTEDNIRYQKRNHFYDLTYRQSGISKSILSLCEDIDDKFSALEPCFLVAGFIYGVLRSMDFYGQVTVIKAENQRQRIKYSVSVKKDIKQED